MQTTGYASVMDETVQVPLDEVTKAWLRQRCVARGGSLGAAAAEQLRQDALRDAARSLATFDPDGSYAEDQTAEREHAQAAG